MQTLLCSPQTVSLDQAFVDRLKCHLSVGAPIQTRAGEAYQMFGVSQWISLSAPVLANAVRKLPIWHLIMEARHQIAGSSDLVPLLKTAPSYRKYSDDGVSLSGAYGPSLLAQQDYILQQLHIDPPSRQITATIWKQNPQPSVYIPCAVAVTLSRRKQYVDIHIITRSSDTWLGFPNDVFTFAAWLHHIINLYNRLYIPQNPLIPGDMMFFSSNAHLYKIHEKKAYNAIDWFESQTFENKQSIDFAFDTLFDSSPTFDIEERLDAE